MSPRGSNGLTEATKGPLGLTEAQTDSSGLTGAKLLKLAGAHKGLTGAD